MKYATKWKIKKYSIWTSLSVAMLASVFFIAYLNNRVMETLLSVVLFYLYRSLYEKQFHTYSLIHCSIISVAVFGIVSAIALPLQTSLFCTILIVYALTHGSFKLRNLIDSTLLLEEYKRKLEQFEHKCLENLTELELQARLPNIPYEIIHIVYGYIHKPKSLNASGYAMKCHIGEATLYRYLKRVRTEYENLG